MCYKMSSIPLFDRCMSRPLNSKCLVQTFLLLAAVFHAYGAKDQWQNLRYGHHNIYIYIYIYNRGSRKRGWNIALVACTLHSLSRIHFPANLGPVYLLVINTTALNLIGLHLFKDDTCHTEHTSRPTQVYAGVFQSCHNLWTHQYTRLYCPVVWTSSVQNCISCELIQMRNCMEYLTVYIRLKNPASRRNSTMQVSGIVSKRVFKESA